MTHTIDAVARVVSEIYKRAEPGSIYSLFLDFDGTLVPIEDDPAAPRLDEDTREILSRIAGKQSCITTIISGRAIEDLYPRIGLDGIVYSGNHGLQIRGRGLDFTEPGASALRTRLERISKDLTITLRPVAGALVECKGLTTSIHYRRVHPRDIVRVEGAVRGVLARDGEGFGLKSGKKVFDIVPRTNWNKGTAVRWINRHLCLDECRSIYLGDDTTDEDAFSTLTKAITIQVDPTGDSNALYQLPDPLAVYQFLEWLAEFEPPTQ